MVTQSIPAPKSQRRNPLGKQNGYVKKESCASLHGSVHDQSADRSSWFEEEIGCSVDEGESGLDDSMKVMVMWCSLHMEQSLDDQCEDWQETFEFRQILWERSKSRVQDPALSQAELLRVLPASVPIRLSGETDTDQLAEEQDRAAQNEQMEGIVDERVRDHETTPIN